MSRKMIVTGSTLALAAALSLGCASDSYETSNDYDRPSSGDVAMNNEYESNDNVFEETEDAAEYVYDTTEDAVEETVDVAEEVYPDSWEDWGTDEPITTTGNRDMETTNQRDAMTDRTANRTSINVREVKTRAGDNFQSRWQQWETHVSDGAVTAKNQLQREIQAIDREINNILAEQDESTDALYRLEEQRFAVEQQLDKLYVMGDSALNQIQFQSMRTAQAFENNQEQDRTNQTNQELNPEDVDAIIIYDVDEVEQQ